MIFYFTGTGNSKAAADALLQNGEALISITEAKWKDTFCYTPAPGERVGFVFPVYFFGLPETVREFLSQLHFTVNPAYTYAVITCGGSIAGAGGLAAKALAKNGTALNAVYSLKMPDNYVVMYDIPTPEQEGPVLEAADRRLAEIRAAIAAGKAEGMPVSAANKAKTALLYPFYGACRKTKKFYTTKDCVSCGVCAGRCPVKAIELIDGTPTWVKDRCDHCMSCIRCNAIQYGKRTVGKPRYRHPSLRKGHH